MRYLIHHISLSDM